MASLDLDKRRAERDDKPHQVTLDGEEWELPARLPLVVAEDLARGNLRAVIAGTFGASAGETARNKRDDPDEGQLAYDRATEKVVKRLGPLLDSKLLEELLDKLYDLGDSEPKVKKRKEPRDHLSPAS